MVNYLGLIGTTFGVALIGIAVGYFIWLKSKPKKRSWNARIWQLADGVHPPTKNENGEIITDLKLSDLRPYFRDILVQERRKGISKYTLKSLGKTTPSVTADAEMNWGKKYKEVNVLYDGESCTLLKSGYDRKTGTQIWQPLPYDRINTLKSDIIEEQSRIKEKKDVLAQVMPYITIMVAIIGIIGIAYLVGDAGVKMTKQISGMQSSFEEHQIEMVEYTKTMYKELYGIEIPDIKKPGKQNESNINENIPKLE